jgi:hypothetical protein
MWQAAWHRFQLWCRSEREGSGESLGLGVKDMCVEAPCRGTTRWSLVEQRCWRRQSATPCRGRLSHPKIFNLGCEYLLQCVHLSIEFSKNFKDFSGNYSIYPRARSIIIIIIYLERSKIVFHEVQIFYWDSSCPKIWDSSGYIFCGLKYLSRFF